MEIVRDCVAASELNTAVPIGPPICWAVLTIADATPASWDLTPAGRGILRRSEDQPESEADDHAGFSGYLPGRVLVRVFEAEIPRTAAIRRTSPSSSELVTTEAGVIPSRCARRP
jgi:hypothetical protein